MDTKRHIAIIVLEFALFQLIRILWNFVQSWKWKLDGTKAMLEKSEDPSSYEQSAQLLDIFAQRVIDPIALPNGLAYFLLTHHSFVHPEYVLKEEVSLYSMSEDEAWFIEAPPGVQIWRNKYGSFHKDAQHMDPIKIIKLPMVSVHRLTYEYPIPPKKLIFVDFIPRTGSTLLCNLAEATGTIRTFAEPHCLTEPFFNFSSKIPFNKYVQPTNLDKAWLKKYFTSVVAMLCKSAKTELTIPQAYMIKICGIYSQSHMTMLMEYFPQAHFLFCYRNRIPTMVSMDRGVRASNMTRGYLFFLKPTSRWAFNKVWALAIERSHFITNNPKYDWSVVNLVQTSNHSEQLWKFALWSSCVRSYLLYREAGKSIFGVKYEDIAENPEESLKALFTHCNLPLDLVPKSVLAMQEDSQENSPLARSNMAKINTWGLADLTSPPSDLKREFDAVDKYFDTEGMDKNTRLPGTITAAHV